MGNKKNKIRYTKKRNRYTKNKRRPSKRREKRRKTMRNKRGGLKNGYICESEGCVFHPSIITNNINQVTKLYNSEKIYQKELSSYTLFTQVDPNYLYHCRVYSNGLLKPSEIQEKIGHLNTNLNFNLNNSYYYIDIEYAGETVGKMPISDVTKEFKLTFLEFFINVLQLKNTEGHYLVHGDPHAGNICYKNVEPNSYLIRYIDITNVMFVPPDEIIRPSSDITRQFSSLVGNMRHIFGFTNKIVDDLMPIVMSLQGNRYDEVVNNIIRVLQNNYEMIKNNRESIIISPESITTISDTPQTTKKSRMISFPRFMDDENDENYNKNVPIKPKKLF